MAKRKAPKKAVKKKTYRTIAGVNEREFHKLDKELKEAGRSLTMLSASLKEKGVHPLLKSAYRSQIAHRKKQIRQLNNMIKKLGK